MAGAVRGAGRAPRPRSWPSSARCRCRWRTGGWCAARAGCCCRAPASSTRTGWRCSGCGWSAPEAAHPLLVRLGGFEATPRTVLEDAATRAAVAASYDAAVEAGYDDDRPERVADAVLGLVAALDAEPGDFPYLADLALPGDDGDWYPAGELLLPGSQLAEVIAADAPFGTVDQAAVDRYGARALEAAGVLSSFGLLTAEDVELDESAIDLDLDGAEDWAADPRVALLGEPELPPVALEVTAVRDLDLVDPTAGRGRWSSCRVRRCGRPLVDRTRVRLADGRHADVPSYTAWWLRRHLVLDGRRPGDLRAAGLRPAAGRAVRPDRRPRPGDGTADRPRCLPTP